MKRNVLKSMLSLTLAASMVLGAPASLYAAEASTETEAVAEGEAEEEKAAEDLKIALTEGELTIKNETTGVFEKAELVKAEKKAEETKGEEAKDEEAKDEKAEEITNLVLTEDNGDTHTYEDVSLDKAADAVLTEEYGFFYIKYKDENGKDQELIEAAEEKALDEAITMYASSNVHIRKEADKDAESVKVIQLGTECTVSAVAPGWMKVKVDDLEGYVFHSFITEDKESVEAALKAKAEAEAAAAAAAAAQAQAQAQQSAPQQQAPAPVYEVSRVAYDDCDGSGHGYYEITYSDGSVAYEEY